MKQTIQHKGLTAIYVRRSVSDSFKGNNSLSINAQKEECIRFVGDEPYRIYCDDGKSGKDVAHRPAFIQMMQDARDGLTLLVTGTQSGEVLVAAHSRDVYGAKLSAFSFTQLRCIRIGGARKYT